MPLFSMQRKLQETNEKEQYFDRENKTTVQEFNSHRYRAEKLDAHCVP